MPLRCLYYDSHYMRKEGLSLIKTQTFTAIDVRDQMLFNDNLHIHKQLLFRGET